MPLCPSCGKINWVWDECGNVYVNKKNGKPCILENLYKKKEKTDEILKSLVQIVMSKCLCGEILGFEILDMERVEMSRFEHPSWGEINLGEEENLYIKNKMTKE